MLECELYSEVVETCLRSFSYSHFQMLALWRDSEKVASADVCRESLDNFVVPED
jgi:hypothetical protein